MSGDGSRGLLRSDAARVSAIAIVTAGIVICVLALTGGGSGHSSTAATTKSASAATGADAGPSAAATAGAIASQPSQPGPAPLVSQPVANDPVDPVLGHLSVSGGGLTVVMDQPSGAFAQQNRLIEQGAVVALARLNASGGIDHQRVNLVVKPLDDLTPAAVQSTLHDAGPNPVLVLPCDTNSQSTLARGAAPYQTLMLAPCNADASLGQQLPTYWPVGMAGNEEAAGLAQFMNTIGYEYVYVVGTSGSDYGALMTSYFDGAAHAAGLHLVGATTIPADPSSGDISGVARAIHAANSRLSAIFTPLPPPYVGKLAAGLAAAGIHADVMGTSAMDTPMTLSSSSELENATFPSYGFLQQTSDTNAFVAAYRQSYGDPVGAFPGLGFETVGLLEDAVVKAHSTSSSAIEQALNGGLAEIGVALFNRSYKSAANHNPITSVSIEKVSGGSFLPLLTSQP